MVIISTTSEGDAVNSICELCGQPAGTHYMWCIRITELQLAVKSLDERIEALEQLGQGRE